VRIITQPSVASWRKTYTSAILLNTSVRKRFGNLGFSKIELIAMVNAARRRDRLDELDKAVEA